MDSAVCQRERKRDRDRQRERETEIGLTILGWSIQFRLVMHYLSQMTDEQTLVLNSGHPLGLFPSPRHAPRLVISNGMVIPNYSSRDHYDKMFALGVTM